MDFEENEEKTDNACELTTNEYINDDMDEFNNSFLNNAGCSTQIPGKYTPFDALNNFSKKKLPVVKQSEDANMTILTGNISQVLIWSRYRPTVQLYETIGVYVSDWDSGVDYQRVLLLRQLRGPVIKVITFYRSYPLMPNCHPGQYLRVIGRISEKNVMVADKISTSSQMDFQKIERISKMCDRMVKRSV